MVSRRVRPCLTAFAAAGLVAAAAGCATVPISSGAQTMPGTSGQPQEFVQPLPPPGPGSGPPSSQHAKAVVLGFLHASANFALDPSAARAYLAPGVEWHPEGTTAPGGPPASASASAVTIVSPNLSFGATKSLPHASGQTTQVIVTGERIATLSTSGQYSYESAAAGAATFTFQLAMYGRQLLIQQLPAGTGLLLTQTDFEEVFQPRNLYFSVPLNYTYLVADPVYVPVQGPNGGLSTNVAGSLVNGLINDRGSWLAGATTTGFPRGTTLLRPVTISNQTAFVDLGGKADTATPGELDMMYQQLKQTLMSAAYSPPIATSVQLAINGKPWTGSADVFVPDGGTATSRARPQLLYLVSGGAVKLQRSIGTRTPVPAPGLAQLGSPAGITALAASAADLKPVAVAVPDGKGCAVRVWSRPRAAIRSYAISAAGGPCTSLSWDSSGDLWAVTVSGIWVLQPGTDPGSYQAIPVSEPTAFPRSSAGVLPPGSRVLALRMAPDAVRAALLVQTRGHTQLYLAAVRFAQRSVSFGPAVPVGTDLSGSGLSAVCWYTPYDLLAAGASELYQVPLTGGLSTSLGLLPGSVRTLSAVGNEVAVGMVNTTTVSTSPLPYIQWTRVPGLAATPAYPG